MQRWKKLIKSGKIHADAIDNPSAPQSSSKINRIQTSHNEENNEQLKLKSLDYNGNPSMPMMPPSVSTLDCSNNLPLCRAVSSSSPSPPCVVLSPPPPLMYVSDISITTQEASDNDERYDEDDAAVRLSHDSTSKITTIKTSNSNKRMRSVSIISQGSSSDEYDNDNNNKKLKSNNIHEEKNKSIQSNTNTKNNIRLLSTKEDESHLPSLHILVRQNIEVFEASYEDISAPSPGRKQPIKLHQVGIRCIHCSHLPFKERTKRAICYPSSIQRVYHSVSDMKFDHFGDCAFLSMDVRKIFLDSKVMQKKNRRRGRSSGGDGSSSGVMNSKNIAQYYIQSFKALGMVDTPNGIFMQHHSSSQGVDTPNNTQVISSNKSKPPSNKRELAVVKPVNTKYTVAETNAALHMLSLPKSVIHPSPPSNLPQNNTTITTNIKDMILLSQPEDTMYLNKLHCFVRRNTQVFKATQEDIASPSPGRKKPITLGQVGIRCIHCAHLNKNNDNNTTKLRTRRAICYPPTINSIYHVVSNMKFDHFGFCSGLSQKDKEEFWMLKNNSSRTSCRNKSSIVDQGRSSNTNGSSSSNIIVLNSTANYYSSSARNIGLVDTMNGIRFKDDVIVPTVSKNDCAIDCGNSN